jgi:hypothetical protein
MAGALHVGPGNCVAISTTTYLRISMTLRSKIETKLPKHVVDNIFFLGEVCSMSSLDFGDLDSNQFNFCYHSLASIFKERKIITSEEAKDNSQLQSLDNLWNKIDVKFRLDKRFDQ